MAFDISVDKLQFVYHHVDCAGPAKLAAVAKAFGLSSAADRSGNLGAEKIRLKQRILALEDAKFGRGHEKFLQSFVDFAKSKLNAAHQQLLSRRARDPSPPRKRSRRRSPSRSRSPSPRKSSRSRSPPQKRSRGRSPSRSRSPPRSTSARFRHERSTPRPIMMPPRSCSRLPMSAESAPAESAPAESAAAAGSADGPAATPTAVQNEPPEEVAESTETKALRLAEEWRLFMRMAQAAMEEMREIQLPGMVPTPSVCPPESQ